MEVDEPVNLNNMNTHAISQKVRSGELTICDKTGRSRVWTIFAIVMDRAGVELEFVFCKICSKVYKHIHVTTSNLVRHSCYVEKFINTETEVSVIKVENTAEAVVQNPINDLLKLLTKWIINDCVPYELIKSEDLKAIFHETIKLGSKFGGDFDIERLLPTVPVIGQNVSAIYGRCFERVKAEIASIKDNGFSLTTDIWTDSFTKRNYIVLTIHYLKNSVLAFRLMGLKTLEGDITNQNIVGKVEEILEDFDCKLSSKSIIVIHEDGGGIKAIPDTKNLPCISQLLNNALLKSVEEVPEVTQIISSCSKLVHFLNKMDLKFNLSKLLHTSSPNCWITVYKMLNSIANSWSAIEETLQNSEGSIGSLAINIHHVRTLIDIFHPFEEAISTLDEDTHATLHLVIPYLHELKKSCHKMDREFEDLDFIENLKKTIRFYLDEILMENITTLHKLALFLYPPTNKLLLFDDAERKLVDDECVRLTKCFRNELKPSIKQEIEHTYSPPRKRMNLFADFVESETNSNPDELIVQEIQYYKNTRVVNSRDFNVFNWWEQQKNNFPLLFKLSCTVLATPATNAASRRIFSAASSLLCDKYKQELKEMDIEKIMFLKSNLDNYEFDSHFEA